MSGGNNRSAVVHMPLNNAAEEKYTVVLNYHALGSTPSL